MQCHVTLCNIGRVMKQQGVDCRSLITTIERIVNLQREILVKCDPDLKPMMGGFPVA